QVSVQKRMTHDFQFETTYLLSRNRDNHSTFALPNNMFNLDDEWSDSLQDQRHRFVTNWVTRLPYALTFAGLLYTASSSALAINTGGVDINGDGSNQGDRPTCGLDPRFAPGCAALGVRDGTRVPRNGLRSTPAFRVDFRLARRFAFNRIRVDPTIEIFNVFNHQ